MESLNPQVVGFIRFCTQHGEKKWPALYDEMCRAAGQHRYQGLGYQELRRLGLSLSLGSLDKTINIVESVTASEFMGGGSDSTSLPSSSFARENM